MILVVDDDNDRREAIAELIKMSGHNVQSAIHGKDALEMLLKTSEKPKLILLDLMMPVMNGWEFMTEIKRLPQFADIPILVVSALDDTKLTQLGAKVEVLKKPIDIPLLLKNLAKYEA